MTIPIYYLKGSNTITEYEGVLIRWLELNYEALGNTNLRLKNFDKDLKDGTFLASIFQNYVGNLSKVK